MPGELWRGRMAAAVESTYGVAVQPATRRLYYEDPKLTLVRAPRPHMFATGTRDNVRALTLGPQEVGGDIKFPLSSSELVEPLLMHLDGAVTPAGNSWVFRPSSINPLASASIEWHDGANPWLGVGMLCEQIQWKGSANAANEVTATLFGKSLEPTTMTDGLGERTPDITEGWETKLFIDDFGSTPGSTQVDGFLVNWDITSKANLTRKYLAQNQNMLAEIPLGVIGLQAVLTFEAASSQALVEYADFNVAEAQPNYRTVRLDFGENRDIGGGNFAATILDMPGAWGVMSLGETDAGTRCYKMTLDYIFSPNDQFGFQVTLVNDRGSAWS